jgi:hypothetical protein
MMMQEKPMTCDFVDQHDLDRRYIEGRLSEAEAAAFEEHFFGCERCWQLVKGGAGVRAGLQASPAISSGRASLPWKPLALAAGIVVVALGAWRVIASRSAAESDGFRGTGDSLTVNATFSSGTLRLHWPSAQGATGYRVRISQSDGSLLFSRDVSDTSLVLAVDSLPAPAPGASLYLDVQGFDDLRQPVARSPLVPLSPQPR